MTNKTLTKPTDLATEIGKRDQFSSARQEAFLNLMRTHAELADEFAKLGKAYGITGPKYNALRILKGEGRPMQVYQIAERMITPHTDVTRLMERLVADGFIERESCEQDRRVVWISLTPSGRAILKKLDKPVQELHESQFAGFTQQELETLNKLLFKARHG